MILTPTMLSPSKALDIVISALSGQGKYGNVSSIAEKFGLSRQAVYAIREMGRAAIEAVFRVPVDETDYITLHFMEQDIDRVLIALRVTTPSSIRDLVEIMPTIFGFGWSYGKIQEHLVKAEIRAEEFLRMISLADINYVALDEMFSQGRPVFGGIDLDSQFLFQLEVHKNRSGEDWKESLESFLEEQKLYPFCVVKDAGSGLAKGVEDCWPDTEQRDDLFHAVYMMGQERYHLERRAYAAIKREEELIALRGRAKTKKERRSIGQKLRRARQYTKHAMERLDRFESLRYEAKGVLELCDRGSGKLRTAEEVEEVLTRVGQEMKDLGRGRLYKVGRYIKNRAHGLSTYLKELGRKLDAVTEAAGGQEVVDAAVRGYQASLNVSRKCPWWEEQECKLELSEAAEHLLKATQGSAECFTHVMGLVVPLLEHRHRASSAIENLNSVLRPYLVVQKNVEQGFLNLFRFYWNMRNRQWGRGKGTSPYEELTGQRVDDWLTLLGYPPSKSFSDAV